VLTTTGMMPGAPALLFTAQNATNGGLGQPFGDGLRCAGGAALRIGVVVSDPAGPGVWGPNLARQAGWRAVARVPRPNTFHRSRSDLPPTSTVLLTGKRAAMEIVEALCPECVPR
jgi:hypothetical protein